MSAIAQVPSINPLKTQSFPRIQQLLFATDFSDASRAALPFAAAIADTFKSELHLLHLLMPEAYRYLPPERIPASVNSLKDDAQRAMQDLRSSVLLHGIRLTSEVAKGELGLLLRRIGDRDIDMLVIGTHGRQGFRRLLLGSIADKDLDSQAHFVSYAPPLFVAFHDHVYLQLSITTNLSASSAGSRYRMAALAFDDHIAHLIRPVAVYFQGQSNFDGVVFSTSIHVTGADTPEAVEFFLPFSTIHCYEQYDCTGQQVVTSSYVFINGERASLDLQIAEGASY